MHEKYSHCSLYIISLESRAYTLSGVAGITEVLDFNFISGEGLN